MTSMIPWEPAIYEHKAALIGRGVYEVSRSSGLLADALLAEHRAYQADALAVGLDLYNLEAEACGATVGDLGFDRCPETQRPIWDIDALPDSPRLPEIARDGRFSMMLEAAAAARRSLPGQVGLRIAGSGPLSLAAKLVGLEPLILSLACDEPAGPRLLGFATEVGLAWADAVRAAGFDLMLFDSSASPPMLSPDLFRRHVAPCHQRLMHRLQGLGQSCRPMVMGGDTLPILPDLIATGTNYLVCDFPADASAFARHCPPGLAVRRNVNPKALLADEPAVDAAAERLLEDLDAIRSAGLIAIAGTGVLPHGTDPRRIHRLMQRLGRGGA